MDSSNIDQRQSLCNDQAVGPITKVQLPGERITALHAIMFDLDPSILAPGNAIFPPANTPQEFFDGIKHIVERHPLARYAEVRVSGTGLHLLLWMKPEVQLSTAREQHRWGAIVKAVQRTLPIDPDMPGITAVTRPIGSINSKNGTVVTTLHAGEPVSPEIVEQYMTTLATAAFREVVMPLLGTLRMSPCPVCRAPGTRLEVCDWVGSCYGNCGKMTVADLLDWIYIPRPATQKTEK